MREQAVIAHTDSPTAGDPPGNEGGNQIRPAKGKQRADRRKCEK
jgi:hypothetical protein